MGSNPWFMRFIIFFLSCGLLSMYIFVVVDIVARSGSTIRPLRGTLRNRARRARDQIRPEDPG